MVLSSESSDQFAHHVLQCSSIYLCRGISGPFPTYPSRCTVSLPAVLRWTVSRWAMRLRVVRKTHQHLAGARPVELPSSKRPRLPPQPLGRQVMDTMTSSPEFPHQLVENYRFKQFGSRLAVPQEVNQFVALFCCELVKMVPSVPPCYASPMPVA